MGDTASTLGNSYESCSGNPSHAQSDVLEGYIRQQALSEAVKAGEGAQQTVDRAKLYFDFLKGA